MNEPPNSVLAGLSKPGKQTPHPPAPPPQTPSRPGESPSGFEGAFPRGNPGGSQPLTRDDGHKIIAEMKARLADAARRAELQGVVPPSKEAITLIRRSLGFQVPAEILQQLDVLRSQYSEAFARVMENTRDAARKSYVKHQEELTLAVADSNRSVLREMTVWNLPEWLEEAEGKMKAAKGLCQRIGYQIHELLKPSFIAFAEGLEELALGIVEREYGEAVSLGLEVGWRPSSVERTLRRAALDFRDHAASNHAGASPPGSIISGLIDEHQAEGGSNG